MRIYADICYNNVPSLNNGKYILPFIELFIFLNNTANNNGKYLLPFIELFKFLNNTAYSVITLGLLCKHVLTFVWGFAYFRLKPFMFSFKAVQIFV